MSDTDPYAAPEYNEPNVEQADPTVDSFNQEVSEEAVEAPQTDEEAVPEGSIKEVLAWVGDDAEKAEKALSAELDGENRKTLVSKLNEIIN
jgi:hypothetical protein